MELFLTLMLLSPETYEILAFLYGLLKELIKYLFF